MAENNSITLLVLGILGLVAVVGIVGIFGMSNTISGFAVKDKLKTGTSDNTAYVACVKGVISMHNAYITEFCERYRADTPDKYMDCVQDAKTLLVKGLQECRNPTEPTPSPIVPVADTKG